MEEPIFLSLISCMQSYTVLSLEMSAIKIAAIARAASLSIFVINNIFIGVDTA